MIYGTSRKTIEGKNRINVLNVDVTDVVSVKSAVETVIKKEGRIDVLINNAGMGVSGPIEYSSIEGIKLQMGYEFHGYGKYDSICITCHAEPGSRNNCQY